MRIFVRTALVGAVALVAGSSVAGVASAQDVPPPTPADQAAQYACLQQYLDLGAAPQQAVQDPVAFSTLVGQAAAACEDVRAPAPAAPTG